MASHWGLLLSLVPILIDNEELEWVLLIALILHKTPTAFGFGTMLVHQKFNKIRLQRYLLIFSLATPVGALLTYCMLSSKQLQINIGALLLFSGGTFLYASMHCLEQVFVKIKMKKIVLVVVGMVLPMLITIKHAN